MYQRMMQRVDAHESALRIVFLVVVSLIYFATAIYCSVYSYLWMDEALTVATARLPSLERIWFSVFHGGTYSPPTYHILLHYIAQWFGEPSGRLLWRLPSIFAIFGAALCVRSITQRVLGPWLALLAFSLILASPLFPYAAIQARPYALMTFCFSLAWWSWTRFQDNRHPYLLCVVLWTGLAGCICLHFYGVIEIIVVGFAELLWLVITRQLRIPIWLTLIALLPLIAYCYHLGLILNDFNKQDAQGELFYGKPSVAFFLLSLPYLIIGGRALRTSIGLLVLIDFGLNFIKGKSAARINTPYMSARPEDKLSFHIMIVSLLIMPLFTFGLAYFVIKSFSIRYTIPSVILVGVIIAFFFRKTPFARGVTMCMLPLACYVIAEYSGKENALAPPIGPSRQLVLRHVDESLPIVIAEGQLYIELMEALDKPARQNLVYLTMAPGQISPDPTNENQVKRQASFVPEYRMVSQEKFIISTRRFYLLERDGITTDTTTPWLKNHAHSFKKVDEENGSKLWLIESGTYRK